jgi:lipopolysaccharide/colanic/teichoic acid biosynthesis glycosyltransferase
MQRFFDFLFSALALVILSPLLVPIVLILRFSGEGEIFFLQERVGKGGKPFKLYKFATMLKNSAAIGTGTVTVRNDPRVLPAGKFLRKTKINELPQLLNILFGDMSIIGPRPQTRRCFDAFPKRSQEKIMLVRPGLSGIGSIVFRDEENMMHGHENPHDFYDEVIMPYKGQLEEWYVEHATLRNYFLLIFLTVWAVLVPGTDTVYQAFRDLPQPERELVAALDS